MKISSLFQPITINTMKLRNRLIVPSMGTNYAHEDGTLSERFIAYYERRAIGGFSLISTEVIAVDPRGNAGPCEPGLYDDRFLPGFEELARRIHAHGACLSIQLHHAGRQTVHHYLNGQRPVAPSPLPCPVCGEVPEELTEEEIFHIAEKFGEAAERAQRAGADAVEIHGAHGYLIAEFMSSYSNRRIDRFGGSLENRMRFPRLIISAIRRRTGPDFPLLFRISAEEHSLGGRGIAETRTMARILEDAGIDALHVSTATYADMENLWGSGAQPLAALASYAEDIKKSVSIPVITVGRINDPYIAEEILATGRADMIAVGRQSLADPDFPKKILEGRIDEICPCIACHDQCTGNILAGKQTGCAINPFTGQEYCTCVHPAEHSRHIAVVGGGPAGMMCAWILAKRGHTVDLYEKSSHLGGQFRIAAFPPAKGELAKALRWLIVMCEKYGVRIHRQCAFTPDTVHQTSPEIVVLATGSTPLLPPIEGIHAPELLQASDVLSGRALTGRRVLIAGAGMVGAETADYLSSYGREVTMVELKDEVAADLSLVPRTELLRRLESQHVNAVTGAAIVAFHADGVTYTKNQEQHTLKNFDSVVLALGSRAYNPLEETLKKSVPTVVIGDALHAGKVAQAMKSAMETALSL